MLQIASATTQKLASVLGSDTGIAAAIGTLVVQQGLTLPIIAENQIIPQNVTPDISERSMVSNYPLLYVYCNKMVNELLEKFRTFSGNAQMVIEVRVSQDRLENIDTNLHAYVDAVTQVLNSSRGDWGDGVFYSGGYEVSFGGVKQGGRNFIQIAKVGLVLDVSAD